jgi:hypothetical protein
MNSEQMEKYSSAVTLSDMEIFVFPELMYSLVLADIMSPVIWQWREDDCFKKLDGKGSMKKLMRLRQYIMDNYEFNLDLETWGLTTKQQETARFEKFLPADVIAQSNALFGYQGDKYYFDVDIRKHFGLDKYTTDVIPYWKTETVEAMNAFRHKPGYSTGAGECVSLSALYAAAAFIVCGVPLEDIFMVLTPLHSQNFIDIDEGILTNNRRLLTKTMWFNGTAITAKAQRALRNENITIVAHPSGFIHCIYRDATINTDAYGHLAQRLESYLSTELTIQIFANFLRANSSFQRYFQLCRDCHGHPVFVKAEVLFHYEHSSKFLVGDKTHDKLMTEVSDEDFANYELPDRIRCDEFSDFIEKQKLDLKNEADRSTLTEFLKRKISAADELVEKFLEFCVTKAKLPTGDKNFRKTEPIRISVEQTREEIISYLKSIRNTNAAADLAFYAYRDMEICPWEPFIKAAIERSPVSIEMTKNMSIDQVYNWLQGMPNESIYDGRRLAQPDEVANYRRGDGIEKAFVLANIIRQKNPAQDIEITLDADKILLKSSKAYNFLSNKGLQKHIRLSTDGTYSSQ